MTFDSRDPGTASESWTSDDRWSRLPAFSLAGSSALLVVAAHPDDETLGAGGLVATARAAGIPVTVVVVTDGAGGGSASVRADEAVAASERLGVTELHLLGFADGGVREDREAVTEALRPFVAALPGGAAVVAPWSGDGHRDHRVLGEIAVDLAAERSLDLLGYPIWLWHWADPADSRVPWGDFVSLALDEAASARKARALAAYVSQTTGASLLLHARFLANFARSAEVFVRGA